MQNTTPPLGSRENPVRCDMSQGAQDYLSRLLDYKGQRISFEHEASPNIPAGELPDLYIIRDSRGRRTEIYIDMYHPGYVEHEAIPGFTLIQFNPEYYPDISSVIPLQRPEGLSYLSYKYMLYLKAQLPDILQFGLSPSWGYVCSKGGQLMQAGLAPYLERDPLTFDPAAFDEDIVLALSSQLVEDLRGFHPDYPLTSASLEDLTYTLLIFHFEYWFKLPVQNQRQERVWQVYYRHIQEDSLFMVFFQKKRVGVE